MKTAIYCRLSEEDRNKVNKEDDSNSIVKRADKGIDDEHLNALIVLLCL